MKKLAFLFAAFLLGLFVSITIHACGGDKSQTEISGGGVNNDPSGGAACSCQWSVQKMAYTEDYDENGVLTSRSDYTYDDAGREKTFKNKTYSKSTSGTYYAYILQEGTYSYSGNTRTTTSILTYYNENGNVQQVLRSTRKEVLYVK